MLCYTLRYTLWPRSTYLKSQLVRLLFFSRNSVFLSQQFSRNSVLTCFFSQIQPNERAVATDARCKTQLQMQCQHNLHCLSFLPAFWGTWILYCLCTCHALPLLITTRISSNSQCTRKPDKLCCQLSARFSQINKLWRPCMQFSV